MAEQRELNLKFDGKEEILQLAKDIAASRGESLNDFCIRAIAQACGIRSQPHLSLGVDVDRLLEKTLAPVVAKLENVEAAREEAINTDSLPRTGASSIGQPSK